MYSLNQHFMLLYILKQIFYIYSGSVSREFSSPAQQEKKILTPIREFLVLPMVVRVLRLKIRVNSAFSKGRVREVKAGCWILE